MKKPSVVVRHGGHQSAHTVYLSGGRKFTCSQFGSATLAGGTTYLSQYMRLAPYALLDEATHLVLAGVPAPFRLLTVDERCLVTTPFQAAYSRKVAGVHQRGTCGTGNGETYRYALAHPDQAIHVRDLRDKPVLLDKLAYMFHDVYGEELVKGDELLASMDDPVQDITDILMGVGALINITDEAYWIELRDSYERAIAIFDLQFGDNAKGATVDFLASHYDEPVMLIEGTQGVLLDREDALFQPYVTSNRTTDINVNQLMDGYKGRYQVIGLTRILTSRHGVGPLPTETSELNIFSEDDNTPNDLQGAMRYGWLDLALLQYAVNKLVRVDYLGISHLDQFEMLDRWKMAFAYRPQLLEAPQLYMTHSDRKRYIDTIASELNVPLGIIAQGKTRNDRHIYNAALK